MPIAPKHASARLPLMLHRILRPWPCPTRSPTLLPFSQLPPCRPRFHSTQKATFEARTSCAILFANPASATTEQLLESITPVSLQKHELCREYGAVLLFTPCFAHRIAYESTFLPAVVNRLCEELTPFPELECTLNTIVAVVDRIPRPSKTWHPNNVESAHHRARRPPVGDTGSEGMAYVVARPVDVGLSGRKRDVDDQQREIKSITLDISTTNFPHDVQVQVPLANTIFQAGQESILSNINWLKPVGSAMLAKRYSKHLSHAKIPLLFPTASYGKVKALSVPLVPLTVPRQITAAMGNVVRRISAPEQAKPVAPASKELEHAVHTYFATRALPPSAVSVWALILPPESHGRSRSGIDPAAVPLSTWRSDPPVWDGRFYEFLIQGARLHRVLSGGGGWGNKAGLISLDPESHFGINQRVMVKEGARVESDGTDTNEFPVEMLGTAAKVGDYIQFFIAPADYDDTYFPQDGNAANSLDFGTIPSTIDEIPMPSTEESLETKDMVETFPDHFGILSEKGISLNLPCHDRKAGGTVIRNTSKLDVPYSRLSMYTIPELLPADGTKSDSHDTGENAPRLNEEGDLRLYEPPTPRPVEELVSPDSAPEEQGDLPVHELSAPGAMWSEIEPASETEEQDPSGSVEPWSPKAPLEDVSPSIQPLNATAPDAIQVTQDLEAITARVTRMLAYYAKLLIHNEGKSTREATVAGPSPDGKSQPTTETATEKSGLNNKNWTPQEWWDRLTLWEREAREITDDAEKLLFWRLRILERRERRALGIFSKKPVYPRATLRLKLSHKQGYPSVTGDNATQQAGPPVEPDGQLSPSGEGISKSNVVYVWNKEAQEIKDDKERLDFWRKRIIHHWQWLSLREVDYDSAIKMQRFREQRDVAVPDTKQVETTDSSPVASVQQGHDESIAQERPERTGSDKTTTGGTLAQTGMPKGIANGVSSSGIRSFHSCACRRDCSRVGSRRTYSTGIAELQSMKTKQVSIKRIRTNKKVLQVAQRSGPPVKSFKKVIPLITKILVRDPPRERVARSSSDDTLGASTKQSNTRYLSSPGTLQREGVDQILETSTKRKQRIRQEVTRQGAPIRKYTSKDLQVRLLKVVHPGSSLITGTQPFDSQTSTDHKRVQVRNDNPLATAQISVSNTQPVELPKARLGGRQRSRMRGQLNIRYHVVHPIHDKMRKYVAPRSIVQKVSSKPRPVHRIVANSDNISGRAPNPTYSLERLHRRNDGLNIQRPRSRSTQRQRPLIRKHRLLPRQPRPGQSNRVRDHHDSPLLRIVGQVAGHARVRLFKSTSLDRHVVKFKRHGPRPGFSFARRIEFTPSGVYGGSFRKVDSTSHDIANPEEQKRRAAKVALRIRKFESEWWENPVKYAWDLMERKRLRDERKESEKAESLGKAKQGQMLPAPEENLSELLSVPEGAEDALSSLELQQTIGNDDVGLETPPEFVPVQSQGEPEDLGDASSVLGSSVARGSSDALSEFEATLPPTPDRRVERKRSKGIASAPVEAGPLRRTSSPLPDFVAAFPEIAALPPQRIERLSGVLASVEGKKMKKPKMPGRRGVDSKALKLAEEVRALLKGF